MSEQCILYVDGYNFYYSIKKHPASTPLHLGWCDFGVLAKTFMLPSGSELKAIKYFTAPVGNYGEKGGPLGAESKRQDLWLRALETIPGLEIIRGYHTGNWGTARGRKEKESDVNLAVHAVADAARSRVDRAILLSGDRDQQPTARMVALEFGKKVDVWLSPNHSQSSWAGTNLYSGVRVHSIKPYMLAKARLADRIETAAGVIEAPRIWRDPRKPV